MTRESKIMIAIAAVFVGILVAIFMIGNKTGAPNSPAVSSALLVKANSHKEGSGPVTVVEFGDYQCPACEAAYPILKQLQADYPTQLTFVFRNYPLPMHPNAPEAAEAAEAAGAQGKYWQMHNKLYDTQSSWADLPDPTSDFVTYAQQLGLNVAQFQSDVASKKYASVIAADQADGNTLGIQGTPTIYVDGVQAQSYDLNTLKSMVAADLKK